MAFAKTVTTVITALDCGENAESALSSCTVLDTTTAIGLVDVDVSITYVASNAFAAVIRSYGSSDNSTWDTLKSATPAGQPFDEWTHPNYTAAGTIIARKAIVPAAKYIKFTVYNPNTGAYHYTATIKVTMQTGP